MTPSFPPGERPRVLVLSRNYPSPAVPLLGLWVRQLMQGMATTCDQVVVAPVPWAPPVPRLPEYYTRFRRVPRRRDDDGIEVLHPRFVVGMGTSLEAIEPITYHAAVRGLVRKVRERFPFDLIHAHFTWPDGVVAAKLARHYRVPFLVTEQAPWLPWLETNARKRRQSVWAAQQAAFTIAISNAVRESIEHFTGSSARVRVIPDAVDGAAFTLSGAERAPDELLFVGVIRHVKGVDVLLRALRLVKDRGRVLSLSLIGEGHYRSYHRDQRALYDLVEELGLQEQVRFLGKKPLSELVEAMQQSALLVLPSRAESLGMVLVEALACGTPVVATRCGGPEDIVTEAVGELVAPDDPVALADGIERVLDRSHEFDPARLRAHALERFGVEPVSARVAELYAQALSRQETASDPAPRRQPLSDGAL